MPKKNAGYRLKWREERNVWEIVWFEQGRRKRLATGTADRQEADKILIRHIESSQRRAASRLIGDILADYQLEHAPHVADPIRIGHAVLHLAPFFGEMSDEQFTKAACKEYFNARTEQGAAIGTIRRELQTLRAAFNHDWSEGRIKAVPPVWMPSASQPKDRWLTRKEAAALLRASRHGSWHLPWFVLISLYSGQRKRAVLNLTWDRVDLVNGTINWQYGRDTKKRRVRQPLSDELWMFLRLLSKQGTKGYVLHRNGKNIDDVRRGLAAALKASGIRGVTPHTLKHTAITWMLQSGTGIWAVAGFTGTSVKTIEMTYGHHAPDYLEEARTSSKRARMRRMTAPTLPQGRSQKAG